MQSRAGVDDRAEDDPMAWQRLANCLGLDPDVFFPERGASTREAKEVCRGCVVRLECLDYAVDNGERFGIWGGLSERERRKVRRARANRRGAASA
ncbi:MAG TPA: WhiB family transcriptional regulator [Acidimicrobiales bacterium]|nr:WhiB family transcriptional regulator [Acidimicrobiales bacterium]